MIPYSFDKNLATAYEMAGTASILKERNGRFLECLSDYPFHRQLPHESLTDRVPSRQLGIRYAGNDPHKLHYLPIIRVRSRMHKSDSCP